MAWNTLPTVGGNEIEAFELASGVFVPSSVLRALDAAGDPAALRMATTDGVASSQSLLTSTGLVASDGTIKRARDASNSLSNGAGLTAAGLFIQQGIDWLPMSGGAPGDNEDPFARGALTNARLLVLDRVLGKYIRPGGDVANGIDVDVTRMPAHTNVNVSPGPLAAGANTTGSTMAVSNVKRVVAHATTDAPGTLYIEERPPSGMWRRVRAARTAQDDPTCSWFAEIVFSPSTGEARVAYVNDADAAQTYFDLTVTLS